MLRMSIFNGTFNGEELKEFIRKTRKPIRCTYGLDFRDPTTNKVLISKEKAIKLAEKESFLDVDENDDYIHLNIFSSNDLF